MTCDMNNTWHEHDMTCDMNNTWHEHDMTHDICFFLKKIHKNDT